MFNILLYLHLTFSFLDIILDSGWMQENCKRTKFEVVKQTFLTSPSHFPWMTHKNFYIFPAWSLMLLAEMFLVIKEFNFSWPNLVLFTFLASLFVLQIYISDFLRKYKICPIANTNIWPICFPCSLLAASKPFSKNMKINLSPLWESLGNLYSCSVNISFLLKVSFQNIWHFLWKYLDLMAMFSVCQNKIFSQEKSDRNCKKIIFLLSI